MRLDDGISLGVLLSFPADIFFFVCTKKHPPQQANGNETFRFLKKHPYYKELIWKNAKKRGKKEKIFKKPIDRWDEL